MTRETYATSTTYGPDDQYWLEVETIRDHVYLTLDENDPDATHSPDYLVLRQDQAETLSRMLRDASGRIREQRKARMEAAE